MNLRLVFLKKYKNEERLVLEYDEEQVLSRLQARVRENLSADETYFRHRWNKAFVQKSVDKAFRELITEFKEDTVKLVA